MRNFWERGADIETERLRLRAWSMQDMQGFLLFAADPEVMMAAGSKPVLSADEARAELRRSVNDPYAYAITLKSTGEIVGATIPATTCTASRSATSWPGATGGRAT